MRFCVMIRDSKGAQVCGLHGEEVAKQGGNVEFLFHGYTLHIIVDDSAEPLEQARTLPLPLSSPL